MTVQFDRNRHALLLCVEKYDPRTLSGCARIRGKAFADLTRAETDAQRLDEELKNLGFVTEHLTNSCTQNMSRKIAKFVQQAVEHKSNTQQHPGLQSRKQVTSLCSFLVVGSQLLCAKSSFIAKTGASYVAKAVTHHLLEQQKFA
jgi:hypothetical protein